MNLHASITKLKILLHMCKCFAAFSAAMLYMGTGDLH